MDQPVNWGGDAPRDADIDNHVAVIGMACRFPEAPDLESYWRNLRDGRECISRFNDEDLLAAGVDPRVLADPHYVRAGAPLPDMEMFDATLFGLSSRDAAIMDPQHRHFLQCAWAALENAGHTPDGFVGAIGVFAGSGHNAYLPYNLLTNPDLVRKVGFFLMRHTGNDKDFLATRASYLLDLKGPSVNVQTACSTSLVAIHMAMQSLLNGESDMALAGGVTIELPHGQGYRYEPGEILSPDGHCRAFDADATGTVFGSGAGVVVLRRLRDAMEDGDHIHAIVRSSAVNNDGIGKVSYLAPSVDGQARAIAEALSIANVDARSISYVEAHGTGTPVGDPIEVAALTQAFRRDTDAVGYCGIGSVKPNIGHTDTAAGVASFIKVAMAMQHRQLPASLNHGRSNPACALEQSPFVVNDRLRRWDGAPGSPLRAGVSSLGVGGTNCHVIMEQAPPPSPSGPSRRWQLLVQSAATPTALSANGLALADHLEQQQDEALADIAFTLQSGRKTLAHRRIVVAESHHGGAAALRDPESVYAVSRHCSAPDRKVAFLFAGGGAQYAGMAQGLYDSEPIFREAVDQCLTLLGAISPADFRFALFPRAGERDAAAAAMQRPTIGLPLLFTIQYATAHLWMSWGVEPDAMIGHSMGEYVGAHLAGVFDLRSALKLAHGRAQLFESLPAGRMLSVPLSEDRLRPFIGADLSIAAVNGAALTVASGPVEAVEKLRATLEAEGVNSQPVAISVAAHSAMLDPILGAFRALVESIKLEAPKRAFVSCLTGDWVQPRDVAQADYWVRHLRETVRFDTALETLLPSGHLLLEVGPGRTLASLARQHRARGTEQAVFNSLRHADEAFDDQAYMLKTLGGLWASGFPVAWEKLRGTEQRRRVPLPSYRFDRQRHWIEPGTAATGEGTPHVELLAHPDKARWFYQPAWRRVPLPDVERESGDALIFMDGGWLGEALAERLERDGCAVTMVRAGRRFRVSAKDGLTIDPGNADHYAKLVAHLADHDRVPSRIFHLWLTTDEGDALQRGFWSLFHLARALGDAGVDRDIVIALVSSAMQRVCDEAMIEPAKAAALGPCRVVPNEYPNLHMVAIDVDLPATAERRAELASCLLVELSVAQPDGTVAYRRMERWVEGYEPLMLAEAERNRMRQGGAYLITGGLGGIGLKLAEHLFDKHKARLALISRSGLPPREDWPALLSSLSPGDPLARRIRKVRALEDKGAEILLIDADVADTRSIRRAVASAQTRFGAIHGVFHAAGLLDDGPLALKSPDGATAVLAPKIGGTKALEAALRGAQPDFVMLFSSVSAVAGIAGQVDYAAANAFLDSHARKHAGRGRTAVIAVGWPRWQDVGMATSAHIAPKRPACTAMVQTTMDAAFLDHVLVDTPKRRTVAATLFPRKHWLLDEHRLRHGTALIPGTGLVEIVRQAFQDIAQNRPFELREILFLEPFAVADDGARHLHVDLLHQEGDVWRVHVMGRDAGAEETQPWTEHARGYALVGTPDDGRRLDRDMIAARCDRPEPLTGGSDTHLAFGPRWRNVEALRLGQNEALMDLCLPEPFLADLEGLALHPALLDFATAGAQKLIPGFDQANDFYAPASYGRLRLTAPLSGRIVSHIRLRPEATEAGEVATFDISIASPDGQVLAEIEGFTMIRIRDAQAMGKGSGASPTVIDTDMGITSDDGMAVIDHILASRNDAQIIVSPHDLLPTLARLRTPALSHRHSGASATDLPAEDMPRTDTERAIAMIWQDMLGTAAIRRSDDFFDLGGHSLLAVQLINRLRKQFGQYLPLTALVEAPTLARLAALIAPADIVIEDGESLLPTSPAPGIVLLRAGDDTGALFLIHDGLGETLLYRTLALRLEGPPAYGIQPERHPDGSFIHSSIADMARSHVLRMRQVQPHGPYMLAGLCAGGVIAAEMALQLEEAGEELAYIGIIDAADVEALERPFHHMRTRWSRRKAALARHCGSLSGLATLAPELIGKFANMLTYEIASRREKRRMNEQVKQASLSGVSAPTSLSFLELYQAAHRLHQPEGLIRAERVVVYKAMMGDGTLDDQPFAEKFGDHAMGWGRRVANHIEVVEVPGGHSSALQQPHVERLARLMQDAMDTALIEMKRRASPTTESTNPSAPITTEQGQ
ncbi:hypothetical protein DM806_09180 [Sphingobium lactosutens]|uniref:type I polyketide synthase n=1 Tax=Sphingobium lactosutens TaxID=522773 RepID=UPI0015C0EE1E|nr:type I polyketide synthase [Sphingobium lactosutens]NWK95846.1 hypothetical protein [Sphingobium lactosutens]